MTNWENWEKKLKLGHTPRRFWAL